MSGNLVEDEVEGGTHRADPADHQMLLVDLLQMNSTAISTDCLEARVGLDGEEEGRKLRIVMLSTPMMTRLVKMDRSSMLLPGDEDGPQARVALLPCENRCAILRFES